MRVLVLGAAGQLGRELAPRLAARGHQVVAKDRQEVDITVASEVGGALGQGGFERVVNCAAYTKVDQAEAEPERAYQVNAVGAGVVARACAEAGIPLCHVSTDFVFGQDPGEPPRPWREEDLPLPRGIYASSKREGELLALSLQPASYLVRTSWLYGNSGPNFPLAICRAAAAGRELRVVEDQIGTPTWTGDLAEAISDLLQTDSFGLYHLSNSGQTSWHGFAVAVLRGLGIEATVGAVSSEEWGAPAPRPRYSVLDNGAWRTLGRHPLPSWEAGLESYLRSEREGALAEAMGSGGS